MNCYQTDINKAGKETGTLKHTISDLLAAISSAYLAMMENIAFSTLNIFFRNLFQKHLVIFSTSPLSMTECDRMMKCGSNKNRNRPLICLID